VQSRAHDYPASAHTAQNYYTVILYSAQAECTAITTIRHSKYTVCCIRSISPCPPKIRAYGRSSYTLGRASIHRLSGSVRPLVTGR
jgi:hypothetical protein